MQRWTATLVFSGLFASALTGCGTTADDTPGSGGANGTGAATGSGGSGTTAGGSGPGATGGTGTTTGGTTSTGGTSAATGGGATGAGVGGNDSSGGTAGTSGTTGGTSAGMSGSGMTGSAGSGRGGRGGRGGGMAGSGTAGTGGSATAGAAGTGGTGGTGTGDGSCTASTATGTKASGTGPHQVTVETNAGAGIKEGTIFRPSDLGGAEKYPIFVWGEGGCSENGLSNSAAMAEIASHGYFVIADGTPNNSASRSQSGDVVSMAKPLIAYIDWAVAENGKSCSAYYQALDTTKIAANGFSCGGLMAEGTAGDPRITTWGLNSSGMFSANQNFYKTVHTPVLIVLGGPDDVAYPNGERDYDGIAAGGQPIMLFSKALGHGGDLFSRNGGDFTKIDLAWLNWWLKGDEGATGKGVLVGASCTYCTDSAWETKSANLP